MGTLYEQFYKDAWEAYEANQKQHAALLFARARAAAEAVGDRVRAFDAGVWEANSWSGAGRGARTASSRNRPYLRCSNSAVLR